MADTRNDCREENAPHGTYNHYKALYTGFMMFMSCVNILYFTLFAKRDKSPLLAYKYIGIGTTGFIVLAVAYRLVSHAEYERLEMCSLTICTTLLSAMVLPCIHTEILGSGSCETDEAATSDCPTGVDKLRETMRSLEQDRDYLAEALIQQDCRAQHAFEVFRQRQTTRARLACIVLSSIMENDGDAH